MYYFKGVLLGLGISFSAIVIMIAGAALDFEDIIDLAVYALFLATMFIIGYKFQSNVKLSFLQYFLPENRKYVYFPFGVSTVTATSQFIFNFMQESQTISVYFIPLGVLGQGINAGAIIIAGILCNRKNA